MGIPSKVFERIAKSVKSFFYVRAPVFAVKIIFERLPLIGIPEFFTGREKRSVLSGTWNQAGKDISL